MAVQDQITAKLLSTLLVINNLYVNNSSTNYHYWNQEHFSINNKNILLVRSSPEENPEPHAYTKEFWIGIGVSILTNFIQSFAMALQRKSHVMNDAIYPVENRKHALRRPLWVFSFVTFLVANLTGSIFTIGYLPIVILAPIGAMGLVFNAIAAKIVLGDPLRRNTLWGTCLIVMGALLVGIFGVIPEPDHDIDDLIRLYKKPAFIAYFSVIECVIAIGLFVTHYSERYYNRMESVLQSESLTAAKSKKMENLKRYCGISYGVLSGNISSQSMLFAKSGLELLILTIVYEKNQTQYALTWIILGMMVLTAILQLYYLNKGLQLCDTVILVPLSSCTFNVSCLFNGLVYYDQWNRIKWWHLLLVMFGVTITVCGVLLISWRPTAEFIEEEVGAIQQIENSADDRAAVTPPDENTRLLNTSTIAHVNRVGHYQSTN